MPIGPGKYDDACTEARASTGGESVVLIVIDGDRGSGFSIQAPPSMVFMLPSLLRTVADEIEANLKKGTV